MLHTSVEVENKEEAHKLNSEQMGNLLLNNAMLGYNSGPLIQ